MLAGWLVRVGGWCEAAGSFLAAKLPAGGLFVVTPKFIRHLLHLCNWPTKKLHKVNRRARFFPLLVCRKLGMLHSRQAE